MPSKAQLVAYVESKVNLEEYRVSGAWIASWDDECRGHMDAYSPYCEEGDLLVGLTSYDLGAVEQVSNWGQF